MVQFAALEATQRCSIGLHSVVGGGLPGQKVNASGDAGRTAINAFYRLMDLPKESAVMVGSILAPHRARSIQRLRLQRTVLAIQDGTDLNFSTRPGCDGLQLVGKKTRPGRRAWGWICTRCWR